ncbi:MAG: hypothetical protein HY914_02970 [Desulfomonile tiedjei]|nr:hypothetical protein [Desulfomonile tiedjei]
MSGGMGLSQERSTNADDLRAKENLWAGLITFLLVFSFWISFSSFCVTFYRDDNVIATGPLIVDAARQVKSGRFPWHTSLVGGGGGTPLVSIMQPGVLNPFSLIPALVLEHDPETMTNVVVSLHLALFALGGWFLAATLGAPAWARLVTGFSLGFSGCFSIQAGNWACNFLPYAFLPWTAAGAVRLIDATATREVVLAHIVTGFAVLCMFYSGGPTATFYSALVVFFCLVSRIVSAPVTWSLLARRFGLQAVLCLVIVVPLLWQASAVYEYYGRRHEAVKWVQFSVPLQAYLGLLFPQTYAVWQHFGTKMLLTNFMLFCGGVPAWFALVGFVRRPDLLKQAGMVVLLAGVGLFVLVLSPASFGLSDFFAETPVLTLFKWPFRGVPAFHVLLVVIFVRLTKELHFPRSHGAGMLLVAACLVMSVYSVTNEFQLTRGADLTTSSFATNRIHDDQETWKRSTIDRLRSGGYLMNVSQRQVRGIFWEKPRLFFAGNLGAQYKVPTVHRFLMGSQSPAYEQLGMHYMGQTGDFEAVKAFLSASLQAPPPAEPRWENGIGPKDLTELAQKTFVSSVVVEAALKEPVEYFRTSPAWEQVEARDTAWLFIRKGY